MTSPATSRMAIAQEAVAAARQALRAGNYLGCYDLCRRALADGHRSFELHYLRILALANAGSKDTALQEYRDTRLKPPAALRDDWNALAGRLHKDRGLESVGAERRALLRRASQLYETGGSKASSPFRIINAATTATLGDSPKRARRLAHQALRSLARSKTPAEAYAAYYHHATIAEAQLILGDVPAARTALAAADRLLANDVNARSRTRQQLALICAHQNHDPAILDELHMPRVWLVQTTVPARVAAGDLVFISLTNRSRVAAAAKAAGVGARLFLATPTDSAQALRHLRLQPGSSAGQKFLGLLRDAAAHMQLSLDRSWRAGWQDRCLDQLTRGWAALSARRLGAQYQESAQAFGRVRVAPQADTRGLAGGILFADFKGFSALGDRQLRAFWRREMRIVSAAIRAQGDSVVLRATWGDGIHVITRTASAAAAVALAMLQLDTSRRRPQQSLLPVRVALHFAPIHEVWNPVVQRADFAGVNLAVAARIEPVTPPGSVFVTEAFAAQLACEGSRHRMEYAGEIALAKSFGSMRLYRLHAGAAAVSPPKRRRATMGA